MAITVNSEFEFDGKSTSYTPASVSNAVLIVGVYSEDVGNDNAITGVTFGGTPMTQAFLSESVSGSNSNDVALFYLASPGTSSQTISVSGGEATRTHINGMTLGADAALSLDVSNTNEAAGAATSISVSFTPTASGLMLSGCTTGGAIWSPGSGTLSNQSAFGTCYGGLAYETVSAGSTSHSWSGTSEFRIGAGVAVFTESGGGGSTYFTHRPMLLTGVGA